MRIELSHLGIAPRMDLCAPGLHVVTIFLESGYITALYLYGVCRATMTTKYDEVCLQ